MEKLFPLLKNDSIAILGSGFAFYGYLQALIKKGNNNIFIPLENLSKIKNTNVKSKIHLNEFKKIIKNSKFVIIAKRPIDQYKLVKRIFKLQKNTFYFLEKPISQNPNKSLELLYYLKDNNLKFKVNYIFIYTKWFNLINKICQKKNNEIKINWYFENKNIKSWKFKKIYGGGILRFYGIQFIAILSIIGFKKCLNSNIKKIGKKFIWEANFLDSNKNNVNINFYLNYNVNEFVILNKNKKLIKMNNPFSSNKNLFKKDNRVKYLIKHLNIKDNLNFSEHVNIVKLWNKVEDINKET